MTKLASLRSRLRALRQRRAGVRWSNALSAAGSACLWLLAILFVVDVLFELERPQRFVGLLTAGAVLVWVLREYVLPFLGQRESDLEMALLVERQQAIDTDLVAALEFENPTAMSWGSAPLRQAVIDYVADFSPTLNVYKGFDLTQWKRRTTTFGISAVIALLLVAIFPGYAWAFLNRMCLGRMHYPTRTTIERIVVNGKTLFDAQQSSAPSGETVKIPYGRPFQLEVAVGGELPEVGRVVLTGSSEALRTTFDLKPDDKAAGAVKTFRGEWPRLVSSLSYQIYVGDAWTDAVAVEVIPLPVVNLELHGTAPGYAAKAEAAAEEKAGTRQIAVLEGSRVEVQLSCVNKPLTEVVLNTLGKDIALKPTDDTRRSWKLPDDNTPFAKVTQPLKFEVRVVDEDGLSLEQPLQGMVRLKGDRPPRILAATISKKILPTAHPRITFGATDDYGLAQIQVLKQIVHENGEVEEVRETVQKIAPEKQPQTTLRGRYVADLKGLKLTKGDQVRLTLEAVDYRGQTPGKTATSEPLIFEITDVPGFLASMAESDEQSYRRLEAIIQRQLGIGGAQ